MNLSAPTQIAFFASVILAIIGVLPLFGVVLFPYAGWALVAAYVVLAAGVLFKQV